MKKLSKKWKITIGLLGSAALISGVAVATVACSTSGTSDAQKLANSIGSQKISQMSNVYLGSTTLTTAQQNTISSDFQAWLNSSPSGITLPSGTKASQFSLDFGSASVTTASSSSNGSITASITYTPSSGSSVNSSATITISGFAAYNTQNQIAYAVNYALASETNSPTSIAVSGSGISSIVISSSSSLSKITSLASSSSVYKAIQAAFQAKIPTSVIPSSSKATDFTLDFAKASFVSPGVVAFPVLESGSQTLSTVLVEVSGFNTGEATATQTNNLAKAINKLSAAEFDPVFTNVYLGSTTLNSIQKSNIISDFDAWLKTATTGSSPLVTLPSGTLPADFTLGFSSPTVTAATAATANATSNPGSISSVTIISANGTANASTTTLTLSGFAEYNTPNQIAYAVNNALATASTPATNIAVSGINTITIPSASFTSQITGLTSSSSVCTAIQTAFQAKIPTSVIPSSSKATDFTLDFAKASFVSPGVVAFPVLMSGSQTPSTVLVEVSGFSTANYASEIASEIVSSTFAGKVTLPFAKSGADAAFAVPAKYSTLTTTEETTINSLFNSWLKTNKASLSDYQSSGTYSLALKTATYTASTTSAAGTITVSVEYTPANATSAQTSSAQIILQGFAKASS